MLHWCSLLSGFRKSRGRLVATLPRRWRSGCRTDSSSSCVSHKNCEKRLIITTYVREYSSRDSPKLGRGDCRRVGDMVTIWDMILATNKIFTKSQIRTIVNTWQTVSTTSRMLPHVLHEVSRSPRVAGGRVFPLLNMNYSILLVNSPLEDAMGCSCVRFRLFWWHIPTYSWWRCSLCRSPGRFRQWRGSHDPLVISL